jgi:signal transduction histidine kinase
MWKIDGAFTATEPHIRDVFGRCQGFFTTDDWPRYLESLVARFQQRRFLSLRFERADGTVVDCSAVPLPDGATLLSFTDVTDSTLVERSLRERTDALETADRMKTEFLANMSYELRSPLTSISGFSEMLAKDYAGALNDSQKDYVAGIYQSSQHLGALIGDIIDLATIEAGYLKLDVAPFNVRSAIDSVIALLGERLKTGDLSIAVDIAQGIDLLHADEMRVKQMLVNLLSNAVKVTKAKGHISVGITRDEAGATRLTVRDDGPGLDADRRAKLFDPFFRGAHAQGTESVLSLSLVKRFMELHGGKVVVESELGQGTAISCLFPANMPNG